LRLLYWRQRFMSQVEIPNRSLFRQPEVCDIASIQPYMLRSWEAEFPDLGVAKTQGGPRVYRRADVERVLRLKHLLFVEGLTLAGARRRMLEEQPAKTADEPDLSDLAELFGSDARERILQVKHGLRALAAMLARAPGQTGNGDLFELEAAASSRPRPKALAKPAAARHAAATHAAARHAKPGGKKKRR
jgi:DNA-binding transcriptional MerR regulator